MLTISMSGYHLRGFTYDWCKFGQLLAESKRINNTHISANWHVAKLSTGRVACPNLPRTAPVIRLAGASHPKKREREREPRDLPGLRLPKLTLLYLTECLLSAVITN